MYANYPKDAQGKETPGSAVYSLVGGSVLANKPVVAEGQEPNACALRVSHALNYSGVTIPANLAVKNSKGQFEQHTFKGADNKWYFLSAAHRQLPWGDFAGSSWLSDKILIDGKENEVPSGSKLLLGFYYYPAQATDSSFISEWDL